MATPTLPEEIKLLPSIPKLDVRSLNKITNSIPISNYTNRANLVDSSKNVVDFLLNNTKNTDKAYTFLKSMRNYYEKTFVYDMISKNAKNIADGYENVLLRVNEVTKVANFVTWYNSKSIKEISNWFKVYTADNYSIDRNFIKYLTYHNLLTAQFISENNIANTIDAVDSVDFSFNEGVNFKIDTVNTYKTVFKVTKDYFNDIENTYKINKQILTDIEETFVSGITEISNWINGSPKKNININILSMFNNVTTIKPSVKEGEEINETTYSFEVIFTYRVSDAVNEKEKIESKTVYDTRNFSVNKSILNEINNLIGRHNQK